MGKWLYAVACVSILALIGSVTISELRANSPEQKRADMEVECRSQILKAKARKDPNYLRGRDIMLCTAAGVNVGETYRESFQAYPVKG
jgi:hypothetical protein